MQLYQRNSDGTAGKKLGTTTANVGPALQEAMKNLSALFKSPYGVVAMNDNGGFVDCYSPDGTPAAKVPPEKLKQFKPKNPAAAIHPSFKKSGLKELR